MSVITDLEKLCDLFELEKKGLNEKFNDTNFAQLKYIVQTFGQSTSSTLHLNTKDIANTKLKSTISLLVNKLDELLVIKNGAASTNTIATINTCLSKIIGSQEFLNIELAFSSVIQDTEQALESLDKIKEYENELHNNIKKTEDLITSVNDAKLISGYQKLMEGWKTEEDNSFHDFKSASTITVIILVFIFVFVFFAIKDTTSRTFILIGTLAVGSYVVSIFVNRYKHARYLRTHYDHLTIATNFYKTYIEDETVDKRDGDSKSLARINIIQLATNFPSQSTSQDSETDKLMNDRIKFFVDKLIKSGGK